MNKKIEFGRKVIFTHPIYLSLVWRIILRNLSIFVDYNFMSGKSFAPKSVTFRISGSCNLRCKMCIGQNSGLLDSAQMLPFSILKKVIDAVYPNKLHVAITGGEPLLHPEIIKSVRYIKDHGLCCSLTTNGWLLEQYANEICKQPPDTLGVSLDGTESIHDSIRGRTGSFQKAMRGIESIRKFKKRPLIFINACIQKDNYENLIQLIDEAIKADVDGLNMQILWSRPVERADQHNQLHPEYKVTHGWADKSLFQIDMDRLEDIIAKANKKNFMVNIFPSISKKERLIWYTNPELLLKGHKPKCAWNMASIYHDGTMRMCDDIVVGDLNKNDFWEIWNGSHMTKFRQTMKASKVFPICAGCCSLFRNNLI